MTLELTKNFATATLASTLTAGATSISLTVGHGARFDSLAAGEYFYASIIDRFETTLYDRHEIVKVTARSTDTLTVTRAQEGTVAKAFPIGSGATTDVIVIAAPTALTLKEIITRDITDLPYQKLQDTTLSGGGNNTLTIESAKTIVLTPTGSLRTVTLPTTDVKAGHRHTIINLSTTIKLNIESSDGVDILAFLDGAVTVVATQATPTGIAHWKVIERNGGARPSCWAFRDGAHTAQDYTTANELVFDAEVFDNNLDFNVSTGRWQPLVPGKYRVSAQVQLASHDAGEKDLIQIRKQGSIVLDGDYVESEFVYLDTATELLGKVTGVFDMDGNSDYLSVWLDVEADASITITNTAQETYFTAEWIAD